MKWSLFFVGGMICLFTQGQPSGEELIPWKASRKLTWADYKGAPPSVADAAASTATYLGIDYNFSNNKFGYKITCSFSMARSWVVHRTDLILGHEQGHFDITEIFARRLNQRMKQYVFDKTTYQEDLRGIYEKVQREKEALQEQYDEDTNHSITREKQHEWLRKISGLLEELKAFAAY